MLSNIPTFGSAYLVTQRTLSILGFINPLPACSWKIQGFSLRIDWKNCGSGCRTFLCPVFQGLKTVTQLLDRNANVRHHKSRVGKRPLTRRNRKLPAAVRGSSLFRSFLEKLWGLLFLYLCLYFYLIIHLYIHLYIYISIYISNSISLFLYLSLYSISISISF